MIKCKVCSTMWSTTKTKVCPKCGATPAGVVPAAPGSAFSTRVHLCEPPVLPVETDTDGATALAKAIDDAAYKAVYAEDSGGGDFAGGGGGSDFGGSE